MRKMCQNPQKKSLYGNAGDSKAIYLVQTGYHNNSKERKSASEKMGRLRIQRENLHRDPVVVPYLAPLKMNAGVPMSKNESRGENISLQSKRRHSELLGRVHG